MAASKHRKALENEAKVSSVRLIFGEDTLLRNMPTIVLQFALNIWACGLQYFSTQGLGKSREILLREVRWYGTIRTKCRVSSLLSRSKSKNA